MFAKSEHVDGVPERAMSSSGAGTPGRRPRRPTPRPDPRCGAARCEPACPRRRRCPRPPSVWRTPRTRRCAGLHPGPDHVGAAGAMLVNTVASGSSVTSGRSAEKFGGASEQPAAQRVEAGPVRRGGPPPRIEPRPMSRLGASQTSSTRCTAGGIAGAMSGGAAAPAVSLMPASSITLIVVSHSWSSHPEEFGYLAARMSGLRLVFRDRAVHRYRQRLRCGYPAQPGSASPTAAICSA